MCPSMGDDTMVDDHRARTLVRPSRQEVVPKSTPTWLPES